MRLLHTRTFELTEFVEASTPPYAILSHTWDHDETSFTDLQEIRNTDVQDHIRSKRGWQKVLATAEQANKDGFQWVWMDTCCIDKSSSAELSEAINSMFKWYEAAEICYAHLGDVTDLYEAARESAVAQSRWFTRGWTLQELIAPREVHFFDAQWNFVASRSHIAEQISQITGINMEILQHNRGSLTKMLRSYSVAQRMSWAADRQTTRQEDTAYSLLGLFDVQMPLLYGEGSKAFLRLQERIIRSNFDLSIFAWSRDSSLQPGRAMDLLAPSPAEFGDCGTIVPTESLNDSDFSRDIHMTDSYIRIMAPIIITRDPKRQEQGLALILDCRSSDDVTSIAALKLSPTSGLDSKDAVKLTTANYLVGWTHHYGEEALLFIDALDVASSAVIKNITLTRSLPSKKFLVRRDWTHLWVRFADIELREQWKILDLAPKRFWHRDKALFDLASARRMAMEQDGGTQSNPKSTVFGLPIYGAIALQRGNYQVAMFFCYRSPSLTDGIAFTVAKYDSESFKHPEKQSKNLEHSISLDDRIVFSVEFHVLEISGALVAHLAAAVTDRTPLALPEDRGQKDDRNHYDNKNPKKPQNPVRRINPLQLLKNRQTRAD